MNSIIRAASRLALRPMRERIFTEAAKPIISNQFLVQKKWAHNAPLTYDFARERIMLVLHLFDKIDPNKLTLDSHFIDDLGLDSLDHVEIILEMEDEFDFEIPDKDMENLLRPADILRYITDKEEAYEELQKLQAASHHHHDDHGHGDHGGHHGHAHGSAHTEISSGQSVNQKRSFCSWSTTAKRYSSDKKTVFPTSFYEDPIKPISLESIQERVMKICTKYDKIDSSKLHLASHFVEDLGLDSLDHVEIIMELEDEFNLEIPDKDAEKLLRPVEIAKFIFHKEEGRAMNQLDRDL